MTVGEGWLSIEAAIDLVGAECLAYLSASTGEEITGLMGGGTLSSDRQRSLEEALAVLATPVVQMQGEEWARRTSAVSALTLRMEGEDVSLANRLRLQAGGELPKVLSEDPVAASAGELARDIYVSLLIPNEGMPTPGAPSVPLHMNPSNKRLQEEVLTDHELGELFSGPVDGDASSFSFMSTTGRGEGGVQLTLLGTRLLATPAAMGRVREVSAAEFVESAQQAVSDMRRLLVERRTVKAPALLGFESLSLPAGASVQTPWGTLRSISTGERALIASFGQKAGQGNAVLETEYPVKLFMGETGDLPGSFGDPALTDMLKTRSGLEERFQRLGLAVLLAKDLPMPTGMGMRYSVVAEPFAWAPAITTYGDSAIRMGVELTSGEVDGVGEWASRLGGSSSKSMDVVVRRTISAHERFDTTDAFIDALIAWDALFGVRSGSGIRFRVALGFALALGSDEESRREVKKRAGKFYNLRSDLVHGNVPRLEWSQAGERRQEAVQMLIEALRVLYRDHPEVVPSDDRTTELLMRLLPEDAESD